MPSFWFLVPSFVPSFRFSVQGNNRQNHPFGNRPFRGVKKKININNFAGLSRKWVGVKLFMCFPFFLGKKRNTETKFPGNLRKRPGESRDSPGIVPGQSRKNFIYVFSCLLVFLALNLGTALLRTPDTVEVVPLSS